MAITRGFGMTLDLSTGAMRQWTMGGDLVKRWHDTGEPVEPAAGLGLGAVPPAITADGLGKCTEGHQPEATK